MTCGGTHVVVTPEANGRAEAGHAESVNKLARVSTAEQVAVQLGWTISVLHGDIRDSTANEPGPLPTLHELSADERRQLELGRLAHLLTFLKNFPECASANLSDDISLLKGVNDISDFKSTLKRFNLQILKSLALTSPGIELAYELGRSIRDTVNPPSAEDVLADELAKRLARERVAKIQDWLAALSVRFPAHAASIVSTSLGTWSDLSELTIAESASSLRRVRGGMAAAKNAYAKTMREPLLEQGDLWLTLLAGALPTTGLLSPEGYLAAGEEALRHSVQILRTAIWKYRIAVAIVVILTAGILYLAYNNLVGAAKVWTSIATIAGFLGLSAKSASSWLGNASARAGVPLFNLAQEDAMARAITTIPEPPLKLLATRQLQRSGVAPRAAISRP